MSEAFIGGPARAAGAGRKAAGGSVLRAVANGQQPSPDGRTAVKPPGGLGVGRAVYAETPDRSDRPLASCRCRTRNRGLRTPRSTASYLAGNTASERDVEPTPNAFGIAWHHPFSSSIATAIWCRTGRTSRKCSRIRRRGSHKIKRPPTIARILLDHRRPLPGSGSSPMTASCEDSRTTASAAATRHSLRPCPTSPGGPTAPSHQRRLRRKRFGSSTRTESS